MARACFNPEAAVSVLSKLDNYQKSNTGLIRAEAPDIFSTHPITSERVSRASQELQEAKAVYHDSGCVMTDFFEMF